MRSRPFFLTLLFCFWWAAGCATFSSFQRSQQSTTTPSTQANPPSNLTPIVKSEDLSLHSKGESSETPAEEAANEVASNEPAQEEEEAEEEESTFAQEKVELENVLTQATEDAAEPESNNAPIAEDNVSHYDFPVVMNESVRAWMNYFQGRGRGHFTRYLERAHRYLPKAREVFRAEGLPEDLVYLGLIESGFSVRAYSRAHAVGHWQFIASTGRRFNLHVNWWVDERRDPEKSAIAAARYLKELYNMFDSWYLAAAAYNAGENKIMRAIQRYRTRNFWELSKYRYIKPETKNYIPKLLAAIILAKNPQEYGFVNLKKDEPEDIERVEAVGAVNVDSLARAIGMDAEEFRNMNLTVKRPFTPPHIPVTYRVPSGKGLALKKAVAQLSGDPNARLYAQRHINEPDEIKKRKRYRYVRGKRRAISSVGKNSSVYVVRRGDTLSGIARRFNVSLGKLLSYNRLGHRARIYVGQPIRLPVSAEDRPG